MLLLAAWSVVLSRLSGQTDLVIGSPVANRGRRETQDQIGFFVNTLVLRSHFLKDLTFRELLQQTKETALGAYAHQDLPFEQIVDALQPKRSLS